MLSYLRVTLKDNDRASLLLFKQFSPNIFLRFSLTAGQYNITLEYKKYAYNTINQISS